MTLTMFRIRFYCIGPLPPLLPIVKLGSALSPSSGPNLSESTETVQNSFLACKADNNISTDPSSIKECFELLDGFAGTAHHSGYDV